MITIPVPSARVVPVISGAADLRTSGAAAAAAAARPDGSLDPARLAAALRPVFARDAAAGVGATWVALAGGSPAGDLVVTSGLREGSFATDAAPDHADPRLLALTRAVVPAAAIGAVETAVAASVAYARARRLYGGCVLDIPHARALLAAAVADLRAADALSAAALHEVDAAGPASTASAALAGHLVPVLLADAVQQLSVLAGSTFYARIEPFPVIEKIVRDIAALPLLVPGLGAALVDALPALPAWSGTTVLDDPAVRAAIDRDAPRAGPLVAELAAAGEVQRGIAHDLDRAALGLDAPAATYDLALRVAVLTAADAAAAAWSAARGRPGPAGDPLALEAVMRRLHGRLVRRHPPLPAAVVARLVEHAEALADSS
ncbi:acyl-CoA dehydrogenase family protein [Microbacterium hominis]|uniref:Acyl-CoA dehydrogenase/oxidase C-terminal domain-containing protein n=1 Tax=Microbacterium hominis TaxID=162426 RepID=A0A7D4PW66_9MICO|nr:acyl-CoA dehydrogenase family protein [Microbacterium hominis]QKJ20294.1 hypothetical protein HQM25_13620 [Microbacterium hominis]